jgi:hypothetical protein
MKSATTVIGHSRHRTQRAGSKRWINQECSYCRFGAERALLSVGRRCWRSGLSAIDLSICARPRHRWNGWESWLEGRRLRRRGGLAVRRLCRLVELYRNFVPTVDRSACGGGRRSRRASSHDGFSEDSYLAGGRGCSCRTSSRRDGFSESSRFVAGVDFPLPFLRCCHSRNEHKFIISVSSQFQFGGLYPGDFFCKIKHGLDRPTVAIVCFGQQYLDESLALAHALGFSRLFHCHSLTQNLEQHGRQIALAFTTASRIAGLTFSKLTFGGRMFISDLAVRRIGLVIRRN